MENEAQNPLLIPEITDFVLNYLRAKKDLLNCRAVNRGWRLLSTKILLARKEVCIQIPTANMAKEFDVMTNSDSSSFPSQHFVFDASLVSEIRFQNFFSAHNANIRRLSISNVGIETPDDRMKAVCQFIFQEIPQVEHVELHCRAGPTSPPNLNNEALNSMGLENSNYPFKVRKIDLLKLKKFTLFIPSGLSIFVTSIVTGVLDGAPNLQELNVPLSFSQDIFIIIGLLDQGKIRIIREISFDHEFGINMEVIERFASEGPQVRIIHELEFNSTHTSRHTIGRRLEVSFNKIFTSSAETLEMFSMHPMAFLRGFQISSKMVKVKEIFINVDDYSLRESWDDGTGRPVESRLFFNSANFSQDTFPNLNHVGIFWKPNTLENHPWETTFEQASNSQTFESVKILTLVNVASSGNWLARLSEFFPSVKQLRVDSLHFTDILKSFLWRLYPLFPNLEKLEISNIHDPLVRSVAYMDSCVTGLSEVDCFQLRRLEGSSGPSCEFVLLPELRPDQLNMGPLTQRHPSLINMRNLKFLLLRPCESLYQFDCPHRNLMQENVNADLGNCLSHASETFSKVSSVYAFDLLPQLKVTVLVGRERFDYG